MRLLIKSNIYAYIAALLGAAMFVSCDNDVAKVDELIEKAKAPDTVIQNYDLIYCDSGRISTTLKAGKIVLIPDPDNYGMYDKRISQGMEIIIYKDGTDSISAKITSKAGVQHEFSGLSEAIGDVVVINAKNDTLTTERLFWNSQKKIVYTNLPSRIKNRDQELFPKNGFEASEDFRQYKLFSNQGDISILDSLSQQAPEQVGNTSPSTLLNKPKETPTSIERIDAPATFGGQSDIPLILENPSMDTPESAQANQRELKRQQTEARLKETPELQKN